MKVSIITTIYKAEKDLPRLLNSMMEQKSQELEFFLIDNGSPDRCGEICQEYAKRDSRFTVCRLEENIGYIRARNYGISHCDADYIGFCDSDDFLEPGGYDHAIEKIKESDCDLYITAYNKIIDNRAILNKLPLTCGAYCVDQINTCILPQAFGHIRRRAPLQGFVWKQIFKKSILFENHIFFLTHLQPYEDRIFNIDVLQRCSSVYIDDAPIYNYIVNDLSITAQMQQQIDCNAEWKIISDLHFEKSKRANSAIELEACSNDFFEMLYALLLKLVKSTLGLFRIHRTLRATLEPKIIQKYFLFFSRNNSIKNRIIAFCLNNKFYFLLCLSLRISLRIRNLIKGKEH